MIGVNIVEDGTTNGTITHIDGTFTLSLNSLHWNSSYNCFCSTVSFSYIGYKTETLEIPLLNKNLRVQLQLDLL